MAIAFADEVYRKISPLVEAQFPGFLRENGQDFVSFLLAYYEWAEQTGKPVDAIRGLPDYQDIDRTLDSLLDYFRKEFMANIPKNVLADQRLLVKYIREMHRSRGSEFSYRFLFRILFGKEIDLVYPSEQILRASAGVWVQEQVIRVAAPYSAVPSGFDSKTITGVTSGATGRVQSVIQRKLNGIAVWEITLEGILGTFADGEVVRDASNNTATIYTASGTLTDIAFSDGGGGHTVGDTISFYSATDTGTGVVTSVVDNSAATIRITKGGRGYTVGANTVFTFSGGSGTGLSASVTAISNPETLYVSFTDTINSLKNVTLNRGIRFVTGGSNTSAVSTKLALANVSSTLLSALAFQSLTAGAIDTITINNVGKNYTTLPTTVTALQAAVSAAYVRAGLPALGNNATFTSERVSGAITKIRITKGGASFVEGQTITVSNLTKGTDLLTSNSYIDLDSQERSVYRYRTYNPIGVPVSGRAVTAVVDIGGRYIGTSGFLSWDNRLQDNYYYQPFSYVIRLTETVDKYRDILKRMLHPAGTKFFGVYNIDPSVDLGVTFEFVQVINVIYSVTSAETITLTDTPSAVATYPAAKTETITATDTPSAIATYPAAKTETITVTDTPSAVASYAGSDTETITVTDTPSAIATYPGSDTETITVTDTPSAVATYPAAKTETITATDTPSAIATYPAAKTETITATDTPTAERFVQYQVGVQRTQVSISTAFDTITPYASLTITAYSGIPIGALDGTTRLVTTVVGATTFADGNLKATTGSISVSVPSSNLLFTSPHPGGTEGATIYSVNTIFSNSAFTIRTTFPSQSANATFKYSTA